MRSVGALAIVLIAGLGTASSSQAAPNLVNIKGLFDFQAKFTPVTVQRVSEGDYSTQPILPPGLASGSVGIDVHSWQGKVSASNHDLGATAVLQVDYVARYVSFTITKAATPPGSLPPPANAIKAEGCLKVTWPEGLLPPPPPAAQVENREYGMEQVKVAFPSVTLDGKKCFNGLNSPRKELLFSDKDSHLVLVADNVPKMEQSGMIPPPVEQAIPPGVKEVGLKLSDYETPMEPLKDPTCVEGQEAAAIEALADPRTQAFVAALEAHFQMVSRVVGGRSGRPLPAVNITKALLSARRSTAISLKESDDGSSWMTTAFALVALVATVAAAAFAAGARTGRRAEAPGYKHFLT